MKFDDVIADLADYHAEINSLESIEYFVIKMMEQGSYATASKVLSQLAKYPIADYYEIDLSCADSSKLKPLYSLKDIEGYLE